MKDNSISCYNPNHKVCITDARWSGKEQRQSNGALRILKRVAQCAIFILRRGKVIDTGVTSFVLISTALMFLMILALALLYEGRGILFGHGFGKVTS